MVDVKGYSCQEIAEKYGISQSTISTLARNKEIDCYKEEKGRGGKGKWIILLTPKTESMLSKNLRADSISLNEPLDLEKQEFFYDETDDTIFLNKIHELNNDYCEFTILNYEISNNKKGPEVILLLLLEYQFQNQEKVFYKQMLQQDKIPLTKEYAWKFSTLFYSLNWDFEIIKNLELKQLLNKCIGHSGFLQTGKNDFLVCHYVIKKEYLNKGNKKEDYYTVEEIAQEYNATIQTICMLARKGKIDAKKNNNKWVIYKTEKTIERLKQIASNRERMNESMHRNS